MGLLNNSQLAKRSYLQMLGRFLGSWFIGFSFALFYVFMYRVLGVFGNIAFGFCAMGCMLCLYADYCLKLGGKMSGNVRLHGEKERPKFGLFLGVLSTIPYYITYVVLWCSKLGVIGNFLGWFKLINSPYLPIIELFASTKTVAAEVSVQKMIVIGLLPLVSVAVCHMCYKISYERIDVAQKVLYKKRED
ncbi:MAG: hypothetical protein IJC65_04870 [Oscillospiraceae bacterium]|nr:hypothetical protein [Oscillospiraceae bacterium]